MILTYTRTGNRHLRCQSPCDDSVAVKQFGNYSLMLLCDGCGSSTFGREAAYRITAHLVDFFQHPDVFLETDTETNSIDLIHYCLIPENADAYLHLILKQIERVVQEMCVHYQCRRSELCCTLIAVLVEFHPDRKCNTATVITIGDGFVAAYNKKYKEVTLISRGDNRDSNPNMTYFCTSQNAMEHAHVYRAEGFDTLLLSSDGISHAVDITNRKELTDFVVSVIAANKITSTAFSASMDRLLNGYVDTEPNKRDLNDDCSLICYTTDKHSQIRIIRQ